MCYMVIFHVSFYTFIYQLMLYLMIISLCNLSDHHIRSYFLIFQTHGLVQNAHISKKEDRAWNVIIYTFKLSIHYSYWNFDFLVIGKPSFPHSYFFYSDIIFTLQHTYFIPARKDKNCLNEKKWAYFAYKCRQNK